MKTKLVIFHIPYRGTLLRSMEIPIDHSAAEAVQMLNDGCCPYEVEDDDATIDWSGKAVFKRIEVS